ncbi:MAG: hypothetical protein EPO22_14670 [Dehalococcoidia bacterium]|nr:MAG: hypothetical protein EPO22_14670 [Dehalococcoidia bacterium]
MSEQSGRRPRRRRGGRGGANRQRGESRPEQPSSAQPGGESRPPRQDTRRGRSERPRTPPGPPGPTPAGGRIQRAPSAGERPRRDRQPQGGGDRDGRGSRDRGPRTLEVPVPQDERSLELGTMFKEAQLALRDARKAIEKRKADFDDEPEWMLEQYRAAEKRFEEISTEWSEHLSRTGRKVVRR